MISMLTWMARSLLSTLDSIATPCSVNARETYRRPPHLEVPKWNLKCFISSAVNSNMKSAGKRRTLRFTALFKAFVSTPYRMTTNTCVKEAL